MRTSFTIYGRRRTGVGRDGRVLNAGVHQEGLTAETGHVRMMQLYIEYGGTIDAVLVRLDKGVDRNGERHVMARLGQGKAWWE